MDDTSTEKCADNGGISSYTWILILFIIGLAVFFMRTLLSTPTPPEEPIKKPRDEIDRIENYIIDWMTVASIFLAAAIITRASEKFTPYYSVLFFSITIAILTSTAVEYLEDRNILSSVGIGIFARLDFFFIIIVVLIIVLLYIIHDELADLGNPSAKQYQVL